MYLAGRATNNWCVFKMLGKKCNLRTEEIGAHEGKYNVVVVVVLGIDLETCLAT